MRSSHEALSPPGWNGYTKIGDGLHPTKDTMIMDRKVATKVVAALRVFLETGYVPPEETTKRGFGVGTFKDGLGQECSFQDSSLGTEAAAWLGVDVNCAGEDVSNRMHLTTDMMDALIPIFDRFIQQEVFDRPVQLDES